MKRKLLTKVFGPSPLLAVSEKLVSQLKDVVPPVEEMGEAAEAHFFQYDDEAKRKSEMEI